MDTTAVKEMLAKKEDTLTPFYRNEMKSYCYSQDELRRLFQESGKLYADEMVFKKARFDDIHMELFKEFHLKKYVLPFEGGIDELPQTFENLNLASEGYLNLAGLLLFGKNQMKYTPLSQIIAVSFLGNNFSSSEYRDSENIDGNV